jgi:hypothetical protein
MSKFIKIPSGCFASDDGEERLRLKREELRNMLLGDKSHLYCNDNIIHIPKEIELERLTDVLFGQEAGNSYYITSNVTNKELLIGRIFKNKPKNYVSNGITGYYDDDGKLQFERVIPGKEIFIEKIIEGEVEKFRGYELSNIVKYKKDSYKMFDGWLNGKIDLNHNGLMKLGLLPMHSVCMFSVIYLPIEIEKAGFTGVLYGKTQNGIQISPSASYPLFVTSNQGKERIDLFIKGEILEKEPTQFINEIGEVFKKKPVQNLSHGITGFYENGILTFENSDGTICQKNTYSIFESWLRGDIDLIYNH